MKVTFLTLVMLISATSLFPQQLPTWYRVYTFDDSIVEMNTSLVTQISKDISRVRFRWTLDLPETLSADPKVRYTSRLEVFEFNCSEERYRPYHLTFLDATGKIVRVEEMNPPGEWRAASGNMMEKLLKPACELIKKKTDPPVANREAIELEKAAKYALLFSLRLEEAKDFKPVISKFFAADYLDGYLNDQDTNWFFNLDRQTAAKASRAELERFYLALLNNAYLNSIYFISQSHGGDDDSITEEKPVPPDIAKLIDKHPYTAKYKGNHNNYHYLAENIDSVERLRSYTQLLEGIVTLMRKHVTTARAEYSPQYQSILKDEDLYSPVVRICTTDCLGLPGGTRLFAVNVPMFRLQLAEIKGALKVVSLTENFH